MNQTIVSLEKGVRRLYREFGQQKEMGSVASNIREPHFFLHRTFLSDHDLLIIFNTKRCRYQCHFCGLPKKCSKTWISGENILAQFEYVIHEMKHSLSVLNRITLSNEGSVLDSDTFPTDALLMIVRCLRELRLVRRLVLETRLEFVDPFFTKKIKAAAPKPIIDILTGFEAKSSYIRDKILYKRESLDKFLRGLDKVAEAKLHLTCFLLFKPSPMMTDEEAYIEADESINFLAEECRIRSIPLTIRLSPMYAAVGSKWAKFAYETPNYKPPRLTDVMKLASKKSKEGMAVYIGLSCEGLNETWGSYRAREDYSPTLIKSVKLFNDKKISAFNGVI